MLAGTPAAQRLHLTRTLMVFPANNGAANIIAIVTICSTITNQSP